ncbi:protein-glutamate O-methyltransferase CheR [Cellvibrio sp. pealriver]|uniref:CheR family methyltransferase n=1 Tax=Cellvibrio sp. pealriver TaxID=1622269 RepID=UPI00066FFED0|nr:protein-glutamate O-methyltransferase CheR [Cellvibrio sp. pealriver]
MSTHNDISPFAFHKIRDYVYRTAGIVIGNDKTALVTGRLWRRLELYGHKTYEAYFAYVSSPEGAQERSTMLDLLTTNETYFFREPAHFEFLRDQIIPQQRNKPMRVWCAASSTGEEPHSIAMVLSDVMGKTDWDILATDISGKVLEHARTGVYRAERIDHIPANYLKNYCRRGIGEYEGMLAVVPSLRSRIRFEQHNLMHTRKNDEQFDVIFLRNVLIYFDQPTKQKVIENLLQCLRPGGWLILGHCESITGLNLKLTTIRPSIYRKPADAVQVLQKLAV